MCKDCLSWFTWYLYVYSIINTSDLFWENHYSKIAMENSFLEDTDRHLPEYLLPQQIESLIEKGKYSNVENRVTNENYRRRMHNLLYLEEYQQRLDLSRFVWVPYTTP